MLLKKFITAIIGLFALGLLASTILFSGQQSQTQTSSALGSLADNYPSLIQESITELEGIDRNKASKTDVQDISNLLTYFKATKSKLPDYLLKTADIMNGKNYIELYSAIMQGLVINAQVNPDNYQICKQVPHFYIFTAESAESLMEFNNIDSIEAVGKMVSEYKIKGLDAYKSLIEKFPNEPRAYHRYAHAVYYQKGDKDLIKRLLNKCLQVDKGNKACTKFLSDLPKSQ